MKDYLRKDASHADNGLMMKYDSASIRSSSSLCSLNSSCMVNPLLVPSRRHPLMASAWYHLTIIPEFIVFMIPPDDTARIDDGIGLLHHPSHP
jgi:hypothetical protein